MSLRHDSFEIGCTERRIREQRHHPMSNLVVVEEPLKVATLPSLDDGHHRQVQDVDDGEVLGEGWHVLIDRCRDVGRVAKEFDHWRHQQTQQVAEMVRLLLRNVLEIRDALDEKSYQILNHGADCCSVHLDRIHILKQWRV